MDILPFGTTAHSDNRVQDEASRRDMPLAATALSQKGRQGLAYFVRRAVLRPAPSLWIGPDRPASPVKTKAAQ